jgi:hypothetical protein
MAEVHEIHEVDTAVETRRSGFMLPFIMFLLGGVLIAAVVVAVLNVHSIIAWPAGQVSLGPNSTVADTGNQAVAPPATVITPSVIEPSATQNEPTSVNAAPPQETTPPATTDGSETQPSAPPADTATPQETPQE